MHISLKHRTSFCVVNVNLSASRLLLLSVIRPSIEYGSEMWEDNKNKAGSLESIILDGAK